MTQYDPNSIATGAYERLDEYEDCLARISRVTSDLLYGETSAQPPFLSVLIPTYQRRELFKQALDSVLTQKNVSFDWEIVVVDNTPFDEAKSTPALDILRKLSATNLRYYHNKENIGSGYNWNRAVELAAGEWVCFVHDDDLLFPDALHNLARILNRESGKKPLGYVQARRVEFTPPEEPIQPKPKSYLLPLTRRRTLITGYTGTENPSCGTTILREAYLRAGGINYDFGPSADAVLGYKIMRDYTVLCSDAYLGAYRWQANESLKVETAKELIEADALFAAYRYGLTKGSALWGRLFGGAQVRDNIRLKCMIAKRCGGDLALDQNQGLCSTTRWFIYKCLTKAYRAARSGEALLRNLLRRNQG